MRQQVIGPADLNAHRFHHRHLQQLAEFGQMNVQASALGGVGHVQGQHHRQAQLFDLEHEPQIQL